MSLISYSYSLTMNRFRMKSVFFAQSHKVHPLASSTGSLNKSCKYTASSRKHRIWQTIKILGVSALAILGLFIFVIMDLSESIDAKKREKKVKGDVDSSIKVADLIHALQVERGLTVLSISSNQTKNVTDKLKLARNDTDYAIANVSTWLVDHKTTAFRSRDAFKTPILSHRKAIGYGERSTVKKEIDFYTKIIEDSLEWLFDSFTKNFPEKFMFELIGYQMFLTAKDMTGIERALGGSFFALGHLNNTELLWFAEKHLIGKEKNCRGTAE